MSKNNKIPLIITVAAVILIIVIINFIDSDRKRVSPEINAVPANVSFILETDNLHGLLKKIKRNFNLYLEGEESLFFDKTLQEINFMDSLFENNKKLRRAVSNEQIIISGHTTGPEEIKYLLITKVNKNKRKVLENMLPKLFKSEKKIKTSVYDNAKIYNVVFPNNKDYNFYCSFHNNFFVFSFSQILTEKAIRRLNNDVSLYDDKKFSEIYKELHNKNSTNLFINYKSLYELSSGFFDKKFSDKLDLISNFADWSAFGLEIEDNNLNLSGYTSLNAASDYLDIFRKETPEENKLLKIFPKQTSSFITLNIGSGVNFKTKYRDYLIDNNNISRYKKNISKFYKENKISEKENDMYEIFSGNIAYIIEDINKSGMKHNKFAFCEINKVKTTAEYFDKIIKQNKSKNIYTGKSGKYIINKLPEKKIPYILFGSIFKNINAEYYTIIEKYIVFGESYKALKSLINTYENKKIFIEKSYDAPFINSLPNESNVFFYTNIFHNYQIIYDLIKPKYKKKLKHERKLLSKIKGPSFQYIADSYPVYTNIKLSLDGEPTNISESVWECRLDTLTDTKPVILINHLTEGKDVFAQDIKNNIYLIDKNGNILWKKQLSGKIVSDIYQMDYYKNNKLQMFFNTKNEIHLIDRNGNYVENYPIKLKSSASSGITMLDYSHNKNYRIFVPTNNKKIYLYDKTGKILEGWTFDKTKTIVKNKVKYFKHKNKDYIVFHDSTKIYILNRKGKERIKPKVDIKTGKNSEVFFEKATKTSSPRFVTTNRDGTVYFIYLDGNVKKMIIKKYSDKHYFSYIDINGNGYKEFIYTDKQQTDVYNRNKRRIFSYSFNEQIDLKQVFYKFFAKNVKIGIVSRLENKIYLINNNGTLYKGFPLSGNSLFSIGRFSKSNKFSLVTGNDNSICKYNLK